MINKTTKTNTYYTVEATCVDNEGRLVNRFLGWDRGMTDYGQPAWCSRDGDHFSLEIAQEMAEHPYSYDSYDSSYKGGSIRIIRHVVETTTKHSTYITLVPEKITA